jgi:hypothetical protein
MEEALMAFLLADAGLRSVVGSRINWQERPQASRLPALVLHRTGGDHDYSMDGPTGLVWSRVQMDGWARTYTEALTVARAALHAAHRLKGVYQNTRFQGIFVDGQRDLKTDLNNVDLSERLKAVSVDLRIWHSTL